MEIRNTKESPVEMISHFFTEVIIKANAEAVDPFDVKAEDYVFKVDEQVYPPRDEHNDYQITLTIETDEESKVVLPYYAKIQAIGFLQVKDSVDDDKRDAHAAVLGATLVYSAAREFLYSLTLRGPFSPIYLPTRTFIPAGDGDSENST